MKSGFVAVLSGLVACVGMALPGAAGATTPCRNDCQLTYNYCVQSGEDPAVCSAQRQQCYNECLGSFADVADSRDGKNQDAAAVCDRPGLILKKAQKPLFALPTSA